jgi:hypothetical protein
VAEENQFDSSSPFSNEPTEVEEPEEERPASGSVGGWATVSGLIPGVILVVLAILFLLSYFEIIKGEWWQYFLVLLLIVFLIEYWVEYLNSVRGRSRLKMGLVGLFLIGLGIVFLFNISVWWPLMVLGTGLALIIAFVIKKGRTGKTTGSAMSNNLRPT